MKIKKRLFLYILAFALILSLFNSCDMISDQKRAWEKINELSADPTHSLTMVFLKTGKSDCILLTIDGESMLIDTADNDDSAYILNELNNRNITHLSYLLITHMDNDHVGAAATLLGKIDVGEVITPNYIRLTPLSRNLYSAAQKNDVSLTRLAADRTLSLGSGKIFLNVTHLFGEETVEDPSDGEDSDAIDDNNFSIISHVTYGSFSALLLGDAEKARLEEFNKAFPDIKAQVIKLPHHGDYYKPLRTLLTNASPDLAVSCVASADAIESKLAECTALLPGGMFLTCNGAVTLASDGEQYAVVQ